MTQNDMGWHEMTVAVVVVVIVVVVVLVVIVVVVVVVLVARCIAARWYDSKKKLGGKAGMMTDWLSEIRG